jgi:Glutathione S-transferase, N-terminal domain
MKVYEYKAFPNPWRVRIALAEKGLTEQVEFIQVDVPQGEHKQPAFLAVATCNHNRSGPQSSQFWDQIKCNYPVV